MTDAPGVTDSPWFWITAFSGMALIGLCAMGPKYSRREASWEQKALARQTSRPADSAVTTAPDAATTFPADDTPQVLAAPELLVPLWPLRTLASAVFAVSGVMLWRQMRGPRPQDGGAT